MKHPIPLRIIIVLLTFLFSTSIIYFAATFIASGSFLKAHASGEFVFDSSVSDSEKSLFLSHLPENYTLETNITISARYAFALENNTADTLVDILVPVADFYDPRSSLSSEQAWALLSTTKNTPSDSQKTNLNSSETTPETTSSPISDPASVNSVSLISLKDLKSDKKLLKLGENYYLDTLDSGAIFRYLSASPAAKSPSPAAENSEKVENSESSEQAWALLSATLSAMEFTSPAKSQILSFTQTGVTALSRRLNSKMATVDSGAYFVSESLADYLKSSDLTHTSNEASFTDLATGDNICSDPRFIDTLTTIGLDIVELTGNHNLDCGTAAALDTLAKYEELGIKKVGGGANLEDASTPLEISEKGTNITFLALNYSTGGMTYGDIPGANPYDEDVLSSQIAEAKAKNHFVIVDVQFNECNNYANDTPDPTCDRADSSAPRDGFTQIDFFRHLVDLGADLVVGTSAHQTQTYEKYKNSTIYYGLGNIFFDQYFWPDTARSLILTHYFLGGELLQTRIRGVITSEALVTDFLDEPTLTDFLDRLNHSRPE